LSLHCCDISPQTDGLLAGRFLGRSIFGERRWCQYCRLAENRSAKESAASRPSVCGEMSQQCSDNGAQSTPQKFLRLVGCRDPNAGPSVKR